MRIFAAFTISYSTFNSLYLHTRHFSLNSFFCIVSKFCYNLIAQNITLYSLILSSIAQQRYARIFARWITHSTFPQQKKNATIYYCQWIRDVTWCCKRENKSNKRNYITGAPCSAYIDASKCGNKCQK